MGLKIKFPDMYSFGTIVTIYYGVIWTSITLVTGYGNPMIGHRFTQDAFIKDVIPEAKDGVQVGNEIECARECLKEKSCFGFFHSQESGYCAPIRDYFITGLVDMGSVSYYRRKVVEQNRIVPLGLNLCPPKHDGFVRINMTSEKHHDVYVQHGAVPQATAAEECASKGKQLLCMRKAWHYVYIKSMLTTCDAFKDSLYWTGATKVGQSWTYPDGETVFPSHFCDKAPNDQSQLCVGFRKGCLDDEFCSDLEGFLCD